MQKRSTLFTKNHATKHKGNDFREEISPKVSTLEALINYSKSLEFKNSKSMKQIELVYN